MTSGLFLLLLLVIPVMAIIGFTYLFKKFLINSKLNPLFSFLVSFAIAYVFVSSILLALECQEAPSELFGIPWFATPETLSFPMGMLADQFFRERIIGTHTRDGLTVLAGLIQWEIILFLFQKWWLRKTVKKA